MDFELPQTTPFSSQPVSLIKSLKIFGLVKMEIVSFLNTHQCDIKKK